MSLKQSDRIYLVGPMGSGKSTVGKSLALILSKPFIDLDEEIVFRNKKNIPKIFEEEGESGFRLKETQALKSVLDKSAVIATGGGIVVTKENLDLLANNGLVIYLSADVTLQYERTLHDNGRPMIYADDRKKRLEDLFRLRKPLYEQIADITIDTGSYDVKGCVIKIKDLLCKK